MSLPATLTETQLATSLASKTVLAGVAARWATDKD
jgi:hypothetical protein